MTQPELVRDFLEHRGLILGFIIALVRDPEIAEEVFQEVGLKVVEQAGKGTAVARFLPWVREIARNCVADHFRARSRTAALPDSLAAVIAQSFDEHEPQDVAARRAHLQSCMGGLTERVRDLVTRRYRDGIPLDELASGVGWTTGSVKVAISRARKLLAECVHAKLREAGV